jgi:hypothetical protein
MSAHVPLTVDDVRVTMEGRAVRVTARPYSPHRWPCVRTVSMLYVGGYAVEDAVADYLAACEAGGYYRDTLADW